MSDFADSISLSFFHSYIFYYNVCFIFVFLFIFFFFFWSTDRNKKNGMKSHDHFLWKRASYRTTTTIKHNMKEQHFYILLCALIMSVLIKSSARDTFALLFMCTRVMSLASIGYITYKYCSGYSNYCMSHVKIQG